MRIAALLSALLWVSCGGGNPEIGVILPLSGIAEADGNTAKRGLELFISEMGDNRPCDFVFADNASDPGKTIQRVEELSDRGVSLILGPAYSTTAMAASHAVRERQVPMLTPSATHPEVTRSNAYAFRVCFRDTQQGKAMAAFAFEKVENPRAAVLTDLRSAYSYNLANEFERAFQEAGGELVARFYFHEGDRDFIHLVEAVKESGANLVFLPAYALEVAAMLSVAHPAWEGMTILGADGWDSPDLFAPEIHIHPSLEAFISNHFSVHENPRTSAFSARFRHRFKEEPGQLAALTYDAAMLGTAAVRATKNAKDPVQVRDALASLPAIDGLTGHLEMEADGDPRKGLVIQALILEEGKTAKLQFLKRIPGAKD